MSKLTKEGAQSFVNNGIAGILYSVGFFTVSLDVAALSYIGIKNESLWFIALAVISLSVCAVTMVSFSIYWSEWRKGERDLK